MHLKFAFSHIMQPTHRSVLGSGKGQSGPTANSTSGGSTSLIAQLSTRLTPSKQQQLHNERFNEAKMYAQTLQRGGQGDGGTQQLPGGGIYDAGRKSSGHGGAESNYGKKSDLYAPLPTRHLHKPGTVSSSQLPPPPLPPSNIQPPQTQQQQMMENNRIYYAPQQLLQNTPASVQGRYQTPPQPIPGSTSHYSINQKIYMSPSNPFLSSAKSPQQHQSIYGVTGDRPPPPSPRHAPPAVPQRSYLQQYHAQNQVEHSGLPNSPQQGNQILGQQNLSQRPQHPPPTVKFVTSPLYNAAAQGDWGGAPNNVSYHGGGMATSPPSSSLSPSHMTKTTPHPSK